MSSCYKFASTQQAQRPFATLKKYITEDIDMLFKWLIYNHCPGRSPLPSQDSELLQKKD